MREPSTPPRRARWGGARPGAGRPPKASLSSQPHKRRPRLARNETVRITARVVRAVGDLDRTAARLAIARALAKSRARSDFRIAELASVSQSPQLELIVEATDRDALARGMQGFQVTLARGLNAAAKRRGNVFVDRYQVFRRRRR